MGPKKGDLEMQVGVLLVEPDKDLRHWLGRLIQRTEGFTLLGSCPQGNDLEGIASRLIPQLILLDSSVAADLDPGVLVRLRNQLPGVFVALSDMESGGNYEQRARNAGVDGCFCTARAPQSLVKLRQSSMEKRKR